MGDYSIGRNGTEASPDRLTGLDDTSYGLKERLKLSKLRAQNQDVSYSLTCLNTVGLVREREDWTGRWFPEKCPRSESWNSTSPRWKSETKASQGGLIAPKSGSLLNHEIRQSKPCKLRKWSAHQWPATWDTQALARDAQIRASLKHPRLPLVARRRRYEKALNLQRKRRVLESANGLVGWVKGYWESNSRRSF